MKVINSSDISPFGGLNFVLKELESLDLGLFLNENLPILPAQSKYQWKDILYSFWSIYFCGGDCIEDLSGNFNRHLKQNPFMKIPSPDRILERFKGLSLPKERFSVPRGVSTHEFSINDPLNKLNLQILKRIKSNINEKLTLDYDNTLLFNDKADSRWSYKNRSGYCPGVGIIDKNIVFIENRNGNSDAKTLQAETLSRMFSLLDQQHIKIHAFRADGASYQMNVIEAISKNVEKLYIRACMSDALAREIVNIDNWEKVHLGTETGYRGDIEFTPFARTAQRNKTIDHLKSYRLV
ncbi:hypothetical protein U1E44_05855, partial [Arenibacter sp. GZD96]|uniref:hypothetical protein n=1 Tax=Aurantibrevibacter litoralis TaxID=3106030 RepID=UPI002AFF0C44